MDFSQYNFGNMMGTKSSSSNALLKPEPLGSSNQNSKVSNTFIAPLTITGMEKPLHTRKKVKCSQWELKAPFELSEILVSPNTIHISIFLWCIGNLLLVSAACLETLGKLSTRFLLAL